MKEIGYGEGYEKKEKFHLGGGVGKTPSGWSFLGIFLVLGNWETGV